MATYKVRNSSGKEFEVDDDKVSEAEKDGFLPVVSNGSQEHRVSVSDLPKAAKDGYSPLGATAPKEEGGGLLKGIEDSESNAFGSQVGRNVPVVGPAMVKAGHGLAALLNKITPEDLKKPEFRNKTIGEVYDQLEADDAQKQAKVYDEHPIAATAGSIAGSTMVPGVGAGVKGVAGVAARIGGNAAINAADTAMRGGSEDDVIDSAETGGGITAALEAIPYVGKTAKVLKRLVPATEGSVTNKIAAKAAGLVPASGESKAIEEVYSNPELRRKAAATDFAAEAKGLVPKINEADDALEGAVGNRFKDLESKSLAEGGRDDLKIYSKLKSDLDQTGQVIADNPKQFGPRVAKVMDGVNHILETGGQGESHLPTYQKSIDEILATQGDGAAANATKLRTLNARRQLDDFVKNADFDKMMKAEKDAIQGVRDSLGTALKEGFSGGAERTTADDLFRSYKGARDDLVNPLTFKSGSGKRAVDAGKVESTLKTSRPIGNRFDANLNGMSDFLKKAEPEIGKIPEVESLVQHLSDLRETSAMNRQVDAVKRGGGPTSQAVNVLTQVISAIPLAGITGGLSVPVQIALLPITNPAAWVKVVDGLEKAGQGALAQSIKKAASAVAKSNPQVATRLYALSQGQDK